MQFAVDNAAPPDKTTDGHKLRELRVELAVTLSETAFHTDIDSARLSRFEHGIGYLSDEQRDRLEKFLRQEILERSARLEKVAAVWSVPHTSPGV